MREEILIRILLFQRVLLQRVMETKDRSLKHARLHFRSVADMMASVGNGRRNSAGRSMAQKAFSSDK